LWHHIKIILSEGATFPLTSILEEDRLADITFMIKRGNLKSVEKGWETVTSLIKEDVTHGFASSLECISCPLGVVKQSSLDAFRNPKVKYQMTHDQFFPGPSGFW